MIGGLLARGMHRGGLDRASAKVKGSSTAAASAGGASPGLRRAGSGSAKAALLLPLSTIPVIRQASDGLVAGDAIASATKKDDTIAIAVDVQAGALASSQQDGGGGSTSAHMRAPSPVGGGGGAGGTSVAMRRKALEMA